MKKIIFLSILACNFFVLSSSTKEVSASNMRYWCSDGFDSANLSQSVDQSLTDAMASVNQFMKKEIVKRGSEVRCHVVGNVDLEEPDMMYTRFDKKSNSLLIEVAAPRVISFCHENYPNQYLDCWSMVFKHELMHTIGVDHVKDDDAGVLSQSPSSLNFTEADSKACQKSKLCKFLKNN